MIDENHNPQPSGWGLCLFTIVDVVAVGGGHLFLEVGDACFHEDVVPRDEFLDVAVVDALLIPLGEYLGEVGAEFVACGFLLVDAGFLAVLIQVVEYVHQGAESDA